MLVPGICIGRRVLAWGASGVLDKKPRIDLISKSKYEDIRKKTYVGLKQWLNVLTQLFCHRCYLSSYPFPIVQFSQKRMQKR